MRERVRTLLAVGALACGSAAVAADLPTGFGTLTLGMPWSDVERAGGYTELTRATNDWERFVYQCGYRSAQLAAGQGRVLITAQDSIVTELSYVTPIQPGSDVMKVAQLVMDNYGQPQRATLRDELGAITIDQTRARYVVLEYAAAVEARFVVSGDPLWEYRISVEDGASRRLENRTLRCARELEKAAPAAAGKSS